MKSAVGFCTDNRNLRSIINGQLSNLRSGTCIVDMAHDAQMVGLLVPRDPSSQQDCSMADGCVLIEPMTSSTSSFAFAVATLLLLGATGSLLGCGDANELEPQATASGGDQGTGGDATGGDATGGDAAGGDATGGDATGGGGGTGGGGSFTPKSLLVALDGVRPDALGHADTPNIDALIDGSWQAGYRGTYSHVAQNLYDADTVSGPNHCAIMTGATGAQHGVSSNSDVGSGDFVSYPHYLQLLEQHDPTLSTAYLFTWGTDSLIPSGADYIKDSDDQANVARIVAMIDGSLDDPQGDDGTSWTAGTDPDAIFMFFDDPDHAGHSYGFSLEVPEYIAALEVLDTQLGQILDAIAARPSFEDEDWQIVITSDHGGYETGHGGGGAPKHTIPFLVSSRAAMQPAVAPVTEIIDAVPTVLDHMGVAIPSSLDGKVLAQSTAPAPPASIHRQLAAYYRFDGDLSDASGMALHGDVGAQSDVTPVAQSSGGKFGGYLSISDSGGGASQASYVTLLEPGEIDLTESLTVTAWFRSHGLQSGDPVIVGNKDWVSGGNPGWLLLANEGEDNSFGTNYASTVGDRIDLEDIAYTDTGWWFLAAVFDAQGVATLYAGNDAGQLHWIALDARDVGPLSSTMPINVGQDGTGSYGHNLGGDVDDLALWERALNPSEISSLYADGTGAELASLP